MKIRMIKNVWVEIEKAKLEEIWDYQLKQWQELNVDHITNAGKYSYLTMYDGDVICNVPTTSYEIIT